MNKTEKRRRRIKRAAMIFALFFLFAFSIFFYAEHRLRPIIEEMATASAKSLATRVVSEAINEEMMNENLSYDDLIYFEKDTNGKITALRTNIIMINMLKSRMSVAILKKLSDVNETQIKIPVGNLVNGEIFSGLGPRVTIRLIPVGAVSTDITNHFASAGINQTRHQIMMEVKAFVSVILPMMSVSADIITSVCIAETVIVGEVPGAFTEVTGAQSDLGNIIHDYGAREGGG